MISRKEQKKDIAQFATMMKDLMGKPEEAGILATLDRDLQNFLYGRISLLVKHNDGLPIGSLVDIGAVIGSATTAVISEFTSGDMEPEKREELFGLVRTGLVQTFDARAYKAPVDDSTDAQPTEQSEWFQHIMKL